MSEALARTLETGAPQTFETTTSGPDGELRWFESQIAPVHVNGQPAGAVLVSQDVTERKSAQAELLAVRHMALLGTLAAGVAHEINTPIQYIGDSLHFLRDASRELLQLFETVQRLRRSAQEGRPLAEAVDEAARAEADADLPYLRENVPQALERCLDGLGRVASIVQSLKEFAHPSAKEMESFDLNRIVQNSLTMALNEYKYVADVATSFEDLPPVTCHGGEIAQVVLNVVVNAAHAIADVVKGGERKGLIRVQTRRDGDSAVITIGDSGSGIRDSIRPRIFDPFFTTKEVGKGTGQGLAIAWAIVTERHGGELTFDTRLGEGTTFTIRLPIPHD
jgi:signal transduction histidine kinase